MNRLIEHIEVSCKNLEQNQSTYHYKRKMLEVMTEKAKELSKTGIKDDKVIADLVADEFGNLGDKFKDFEKKNKKKKLLKYGLPIGSLVYIILMLVTYFIVSGVTGAWSKTWLIIVGGVFALIIFCFGLIIAKLCTMRRVFHPIARLLIVICTILLAVFTFLYLHIMVPTELFVWPTIPAGVAAALIGDLIFAFRTKQKLRTISFFVYMPAIATMLYVILAANSVVTWSGGWIIILLGLAVDIAYTFYIIASNVKYFTYKQEVE